MSKDLKTKITEDDDTINYPRAKNSLRKFLSKNSEGISDADIAKLLMISEKEVKKKFQEIIKKLQKHFGVEEGVEDES